MLWKMTGYSQPSPIEQILQKDNYTLQELLEEEDLVQECKALNGRLIEFLKEPDTVAQLVSYITEPPPPGSPPQATSSPSAESKRAFKYPFVACEVFCCEVEAIFSVLLESQSLMRKLFSILDLPRPLNCVLAGYFSRVVQCMFLRRPADVLQHFQEVPETLEKLVNHMETTSCAEVLVRLLGADEQAASSLSPGQLSWLVDTPLMGHLLDQLSPSASVDTQTNAANVFAGIARSHFSPLAQSLASPEILSRLFEYAFAPNVSMQALDVCIALLEPKMSPAGSFRASQENESAESPSAEAAGHQAELDITIREAAVREMEKHMDRLKELLDGSSVSVTRMLTPFGMLAPPLGSARLKAVEVVLALMLTKSPAAEKAVRESQAALACLRLFIDFPFNNLLHHIVTSIITSALDQGSEELLTHLLQEGKLVPWLVEAPEEVVPQTPGLGPNRAPPRPVRAGYIGHLTHIANKLAEAATVRPAVASALGGTPGWHTWADSVLQPRNDVENVLTWACGRPAHHEMPSVSSVDEMDAESHTLQDLEDSSPMSPGLGAGASSRYSGFDDDFNDDDLPRAKGYQISHTNDASSAFRSLRISGGLDDDSSSSSSDDDDLLPVRRIPMMSGLDDDAVVVNSDSDDDVLMDDDAVMVGTSPVQPTVDFTDFTDFGGFQDSPVTRKAGSSEVRGVDSRENVPEGTVREGVSQESQETQGWNAFAEPTHAGWAAFPPLPEEVTSSAMEIPGTSSAAHPAPLDKWIPPVDLGQSKAGAPQDDPTPNGNQNSLSDSLWQTSPPTTAEEETDSQEFNDFQHWRPRPAGVVLSDEEDAEAEKI